MANFRKIVENYNASYEKKVTPFKNLKKVLTLIKKSKKNCNLIIRFFIYQ